MTLHSTSAAHTRAIGEALAAQLKAGDVLLLDGGLGAGKSELTRGIARGLGVGGYVTSPTFTILQAYDEGRLPLYHFDWYRLADAGNCTRPAWTSTCTWTASPWWNGRSGQSKPCPSGIFASR